MSKKGVAYGCLGKIKSTLQYQKSILNRIFFFGFNKFISKNKVKLRVRIVSQKTKLSYVRLRVR